jgi:hypothetical protein
MSSELCCICHEALDNDIQVAVCNNHHFLHHHCHLSMVDRGLEHCPICRVAMTVPHANRNANRNANAFLIRNNNYNADGSINIYADEDEDEDEGPNNHIIQILQSTAANNFQVDINFNQQQMAANDFRMGLIDAQMHVLLRMHRM